MEKIFTVQPTGQTLLLNPGEEFHGSITVTNPVDATENFNYVVSVSPYSVNESDYAANLAEMNTRSEIVKWMTLDQSEGTVAPNETKEVNFTIKVPETAPAGGQYAAILVSEKQAKPSNNGFSVQNIMEIGSIVYAEVAGETVHESAILENNIPFFTFSTPISLKSKLENKGNVHELATYDIKISNLFTGETIFPTAGNHDNVFSEVVMPETTREVEREIRELPVVGVVHISQSIDLNGQTSANETNLFVCPAWLLAITAVAVILVVSFIISQIRQHRIKKQKAKLKAKLKAESAKQNTPDTTDKNSN